MSAFKPIVLGGSLFCCKLCCCGRLAYSFLGSGLFGSQSFGFAVGSHFVRYNLLRCNLCLPVFVLPRGNGAALFICELWLIAR